jgi:hypothetical protein
MADEWRRAADGLDAQEELFSNKREELFSNKRMDG